MGVNDMVERVAKAIFEKRSWNQGADLWDYVREAVRDEYRDMARAAIEAMREPTQAMMVVARGMDHQEHTFEEAYRRMIDAALPIDCNAKLDIGS